MNHKLHGFSIWIHYGSAWIHVDTWTWQLPGRELWLLRSARTHQKCEASRDGLCLLSLVSVFLPTFPIYIVLIKGTDFLCGMMSNKQQTTTCFSQIFLVSPHRERAERTWRAFLFTSPMDPISDDNNSLIIPMLKAGVPSIAPFA